MEYITITEMSKIWNLSSLHGWEKMDYEEFIVKRRKLMVNKIKTAFEQLRKNAE